MYDLYVNGVRNTDYVVKGGSVQITVGNAVYGDIHTDVNGNFAKTLQAPATPGTYHITMTVTDKTFVGTRDLTFKVEVPPPTPPSPPLRRRCRTAMDRLALGNLVLPPANGFGYLRLVVGQRRQAICGSSPRTSISRKTTRPPMKRSRSLRRSFIGRRAPPWSPKMSP